MEVYHRQSRVCATKALMPKYIGLSLWCGNTLKAVARLNSAAPLRMVPFGLQREKAQYKKG